MQKKVAVVGAGVAGLVAAARLTRRGARCTVFEAGETPGGAVCTAERDGYRVELGPNTMPDKGGVLTALMRELGIEGQRLASNERANKRYIVRGGQLVALPMSASEFATSPFLSASAKLRLMAEPWVAAYDKDDVDESLANFVRRRFGQEVLDYAINPFISGTFAGDPKHLSASQAFGALTQLEQESGSVVLGGLRRALGRLRPGGDDAKPVGGGLVNFERGVATMTDALVEALDEPPLCLAQVTALRHEAQGWHLEVAVDEGEPEVHTFDAVVVATPAFSVPQIRIELEGEALDTQCFADIEHPPMGLLAMGFHRRQVAHPLDGFGMLIPEVEERHILGSIFASTVFPGRAPKDRVLLTTFIGGARSPELGRLSAEEQIELAMSDLKELLGVRGRPELVMTRQWSRAIPQYEVGYGSTRAKIDAVESRAEGLLFTGNYRDGISVADVVRHAEYTATTLADELSLFD